MIRRTLLTTFALVTFASAQSSPEQRIADLEKRVTALEQALSSNQRTSQASSDRIVSQTKSPLVLGTWDYRFVRGQFSPEYQITLSLTNTGTKEIKLIDGTIQFSDLLGNHLYGIRITPDQRIAAGKTSTDKGSYSINQFITEQTRMASMKKEDVQATLIVRKLVFADNTIVEFPE